MSEGKDNLFKRIAMKTTSVKKKVILFASVFVLVCIALTVFVIKPGKAKNIAGQQRTEEAIFGGLRVTVSGSGSIASSKTISITSPAAATVKNVRVADGDVVKEGDVLCELESDEVVKNINNLVENIAEARKTYEKAQQNVENLVVKAPFSGYVSGLTAIKGDIISKNANLMTITDESKMKATVQFSSSDIKYIYEGLLVKVNIAAYASSIEGTVVAVGNKGYTTALGGEVVDVDVQIKNPGALVEGIKVNVEISSGAVNIKSINEGVLEFINVETLKALSGGLLETINIKNGSYVNEGDILAVLQSDELEASLKTAKEKFDQLGEQLEDAQEQLDKCIIKASIDGTVSGLTIKKGDSVKLGQEILSLFDHKNFQFSISIDELDITKIKVGQNVDVTLDALSETKTTPLKGKVASIAVKGTTQNGVTTYPVTISLNSQGGLKVGMNANAEIFITSKDNIVLIPINSILQINNKTYVFVKDENQYKEQQKKIKEMEARTNSAANTSFRDTNMNQSTGRFSGFGNSSENTGGQFSGRAQQRASGGGNQIPDNGQSFAGREALGQQFSGQQAAGWQDIGQEPARNQSSGDNQSRSARNQVPGNNQYQQGMQFQSAQEGQNFSSNPNNFLQRNNAQPSTSEREQITAELFRSLSLDNDYYKGAVLRQIEVGLSNESYIEVVSGLNAGEVVVLPKLASSTGNTQTSQQNMGGIGGMTGLTGVGGAMPAGGNSGRVQIQQQPQNQQQFQRQR